MVKWTLNFTVNRWIIYNIALMLALVRRSVPLKNHIYNIYYYRLVVKHIGQMSKYR